MQNVDMNEGRLVMESVLPSSPEVIFRAFTEENEIVKWIGPRHMDVTILEMDVRPGGKWKNRVTSEDGSYFHMYGVYLEVQQNKLVKYSQTMEMQPKSFHSIITVSLKALENNTTLMKVQVDMDNNDLLMDYTNTELVKRGYIDSWRRLEDLVSE